MTNKKSRLPKSKSNSLTKFRRLFLQALVGAAFATSLGSEALAQTSFTSNSATGSWNTNRWNNSTDGPTYGAAYTPNNSVFFTTGTYNFAGMGAAINVGNINVASNVTVNFASVNNTFATSGSVRTITLGSNSRFDFNGQQMSTAVGTGITISGSGTFATGTYSNTSNSQSFTINGGTVIARGTTGLGNGSNSVLTLNGGTVASNGNRSFDNTRFGGGIIIGGNVQFGELNANVALADSAANLSFANSVSLGAGNRTLTLGNNGVQTFSGVISSTGSGGLTFAANAGVAGSFELRGANTYTGGTTVNGGTLRLVGSGTTGSTSGAITVNAGTLDFGGLTRTVGDVTLSGGTISNGTLAGTSYALTNAGTVSAVLAGTNVTLTKSGSGTATLSGANTYTGGTTVSAGTLILGHSTNTLADSGAVNLSGGALDIGANSDTVGAVTLASGSITGTTGVLTGSSYAVESGSASAILGGSGALTKSTSGTVTLTAGNTYTGGTTVQAGMLQLSGADNRLSTSGAIAVSGGELNLGGRSQSTSGNVQLTGGAINNGTLNKSTGFFDVQSGSANAVLTGSAGLTKSGSGTATLSGANSYTGTTTINAGTLLVNGTHTGGGTYTVNANGTLGGSGVITADVNLVGGTLSAGNSIGAMTVNGNLTFDSSSKLFVEFNSSNLSADMLNVSGTVNLAGAFLDLNDLASAVTPIGSSFTFLTAASVNGQFSNFADGAVTNIGSNQWKITYGTGSISFASVPEPSSLALIGLLGLSGFTYRRFRSKKKQMPEVVA